MDTPQKTSGLDAEDEVRLLAAAQQRLLAAELLQLRHRAALQPPAAGQRREVEVADVRPGAGCAGAGQ